MQTFDIDALRGRTYATIRAAFNQSKELICETGSLGHANISSILTRLIHEVGRFNEHHSADMLYALDHIRDFAEKYGELDSPFDEIFPFGIRNDGVDYADYIMLSLDRSRRSKDDYVYPGNTYRRIFAVRVRACREPGYSGARCEFSLRDLTHSFLRLDTADLEDDGFSLSLIDPSSPKSREPDEDRYKTDPVDIEKAKECGYRRFSLVAVSPDELAKDGCAGSISCQAVMAYWDNPVIPEDQDTGHEVCRIYEAGGRQIVAWADRWYECYSDVKSLIEQAKLPQN